MRLAAKTAQPGFRGVKWEGATWFLAPRPMLCARQLRTIASEDARFGLELVAGLSPVGKRNLRRETGANVGKHLAVLLGGEVWSVSLIETPLGSDKLRLAVDQAKRERVANVVKQISGEIAARDPKLPSK